MLDFHEDKAVRHEIICVLKKKQKYKKSIRNSIIKS